MKTKSKNKEWLKGFSVEIGSRWKHRRAADMVGELFSVDLEENEVELEVRQEGMIRGASITWRGTAQELESDWIFLPNVKDEPRG